MNRFRNHHKTSITFFGLCGIGFFLVVIHILSNFLNPDTIPQYSHFEFLNQAVNVVNSTNNITGKYSEIEFWGGLLCLFVGYFTRKK